MPTIKELCERLLRDNKPDDVVAAHIWCAEDVIGKAKERHYICTPEQANEILEDIDSHIDSELGITWMTLDCTIQDKCKLEPLCLSCQFKDNCSRPERNDPDTDCEFYEESEE
ncbi:MAG: hypothetical protein PHG61_02080 [Candidatus Marinimicrobia bacterium]|jgi:hypothetical protein|nr:hypothetical protein [Candidatus Neomarinimicrobiota bacterium]